MRRATLIAILLTPATSAAAVADDVDFGRDIRPLLSQRCLACHGQDEAHRQAGLALHSFTAATADTELGNRAIVPGDADASALIARVTAPDDELRMPPADTGDRLSEHEVALLREWINSGAQYEKHWSFVPPVRPELPLVENEAWCRNPIDRFVLARLAAEGLTPTIEADRYRLIRRLALDLTGLPPTVDQVDAFVNDNRPDAYDRLVDRLLASPHYGEHWARMWLDLARYADSQGYSRDPLRTIWRYRDWVIDAFNRDVPFDQFTVEQLAGDLLTDGTLDQLLATAFHRNTMTNSEGGTDNEEFRTAAIVDRVNTTMQAWMGLTMGCAQCHTHKYDPITHDDYYQLFAIFNQTADNDEFDERPTVPTPTPRQQRQLAELDGRLALVTDAELKKKLQDARQVLVEQIPTTPIMRELPPDQRRTTHILERGSFLQPGEVVTPNTPEAFGHLPEETGRDRLALAHWLVSPQNPLTARVAVNRHWQQFFGTGLVETSEDFGTQGALPSHPKLLDWLAVEFVDRGWSMKQLCRLIVTSATYRQSSRATGEQRTVDPRNRLLSHGPRHRLTAEQIRDLALAAAGLLSREIGGPSVRPPQPKMHVNAAFGGPPIDWEPSEGGDRYRRGLYIHLRRVAPYPSMTALDATNRTQCTVRRIRTNTPVGAFVTLNDPVFIEAAQGLAREMASHAPELEAQATHGFRRVLSRFPTQYELQQLVDLYRTELAYYASHPGDAVTMAIKPLGEIPHESSASELAAWTVVANVILNLDEALSKG